MNLEKLFEMQRKLDEHILEEHPELKGQNNLDWKILALQVELGECANEWRGFKKWSKQQTPKETFSGRCERCDGLGKIGPQLDPCDAGCYNGLKRKDTVLEEYVDCLHFILSIGLEIDPKEVHIEGAEPLKDEFKSILEAFRHAFNWTVNLDYILFEEPFRSDYRIEKTYFNLFLVFVTLGEMLGFTWEQVEQAYIQKNEINHERQESGY